MREGRAAFAITKRPDAADVCFEAAVHFDETTFISLDAGFVEAEIVGIWTAAGGDQKMRATDDRRADRRFE